MSTEPTPIRPGQPEPLPEQTWKPGDRGPLPPVPDSAYPFYARPLPPARETSGYAVASLVLGILWIFWIGSFLAVIFGHNALANIKREPHRYEGKGMAIAGLVLGYIGLGTFGFFLLGEVLIAAGSAGY